MNPVEEFLGLSKEAMTPATRAALTMGAITAGTTVAAAVGTAQLQSGIQSAHDSVTRSIAFKKMMRDNPDLQKMDGKKARRYFNTLYNTAPELGKDPFAAGSWIKNVQEYDYVDPQSLKTLADTGARIRERRTDSIVPAFQLAQGAVLSGVGEYGRQEQMDMKRQELEEKRRSARHKIIADVAKAGLGMVGKPGKPGISPRQRYEDQLFNLGQESRRAQREAWMSTESPRARGVKSPTDYAQYMQDMARGATARSRIGPMTLEEEAAPRPFPGSPGAPYHGFGGQVMTSAPEPEEEQPAKGLRGALGRIFGR